MGCFVYIVFGSCKDITLGPTALLALMTYQQIQGRNNDYAVLLCFLSGVVQLIMGILHLGKSSLLYLFLLTKTKLGVSHECKLSFLNGSSLVKRACNRIWTQTALCIVFYLFAQTFTECVEDTIHGIIFNCIRNYYNYILY